MSKKFCLSTQKGAEMYIDRWWGNAVAGDNEDSMVLMDYFEVKNKGRYTLSEIINDFQLGNSFGRKPLYASPDIECFWWFKEHTLRADIDIPVNLIIDLSALLLQSLADHSVIFPVHDKNVEFSISADSTEIKMLVEELERAVREQHLYYPDFLQEDFSEIKNGILEICNELKAYY
jgi:hypothetical protein